MEIIKRLLSICLIIFILPAFVLLAGETHNNEKNPGDTSAEYSHTFTTNFFILKTNTVEALYEFRSSDHLTFALKAGYGSILGYDSVFRTSTGITETSPHALYIVGAKMIYYPWSSFEGAHTGLDITYFKTSYNTASNLSPYGEGRGLDIMHFIGYKLILDPGFTAIVQLGGGYKLFTRYDTFYTDASGVRVGYIKNDGKFWFMVNINLGWSI